VSGDPVLAITQHISYEWPGLIATVAESRGLALDVRRLDLGDAPPLLAEADGLVVMGGPMNVDEAEEHPWLIPERHAVAEFVAAGRPVLGVCLGAQVIARALGAEVRPGGRQEIGMGTVELTDAGRRDPLLAGLGPALACFHWHGDTFDLPDGAVLLAGNDAYPHQAFRAGSAWGLQFHVEVDAPLAAEWAARLPASDAPDPVPLESSGRLLSERFVARVVRAR